MKHQPCDLETDKVKDQSAGVKLRYSLGRTLSKLFKLCNLRIIHLQVLNLSETLTLCGDLEAGGGCGGGFGRWAIDLTASPIPSPHVLERSEVLSPLRSG